MEVPNFSKLQKNHLGMFDSELDAHEAYLKALEENNLVNKYSK